MIQTSLYYIICFSINRNILYIGNLNKRELRTEAEKTFSLNVTSQTRLRTPYVYTFTTYIYISVLDCRTCVSLCN